MIQESQAEAADMAQAQAAYAYPLLIKQLWHLPLTVAPEQQIVYRDLCRYSYRELYRRVGRLAHALQRLGLRHGDTVAVMDWDSHRYLECFYAVPMMGAVLQTVNVRLSPEQILYTLNHTQASVLLVNSDFAGLLASMQGELKALRRIVWISDEQAPPPPEPRLAGEYEALLAACPEQYEFPDFDENTRATTFYTTGTTGLPKGVYFTHRQLVLHTLAGMAALASPASAQRFHNGDVYMPITPMFHVHAWGVPYIALQLGVKQIYPGRYTAPELLKLIRQEQVTFSHCVPTLLQMILNAPEAAQTSLHGWKVLVGGSALSESLASAARQRGVEVFAAYGMSETCPLLTIAQLRPDRAHSPGQQSALRRKAGMPLPLVDLRIVGEDMQPLPEREAGEIVARAPWLTQGYAGNPEASARLWEGGYLHTQDIGQLEQGSLQITDRLKDVIKSGGEWVSSLEIEDLLSRHPGVAEAAVIGVKDPKWGERPVALVVAREGYGLSEAELRNHIAEYAERGVLSRFAIPERIRLIEALDKTSVGKIDKKLLRQKYL